MTPEERRKLWFDMLEREIPLVEERVSKGIENNRKGRVCIRLIEKNGKPLIGKKIWLIQKTHDFKFGANLFMLKGFETEAKNSAHENSFAELFNLATVPFYWNTLEPEQGKPRFSKESPFISRRPPTDLCVEYCEENGIDPKLHLIIGNHCRTSFIRRKTENPTKSRV